MPKAPKTTTAQRKSARSASTKSQASKDPKASHLYTDDNPTTTIHGTGFKDKAAAVRTLDLIKNRSLIYQFQTVNTMYNRAKHHPAMKKAVQGSAGTSDMRAAMDVFRQWLDVTYPSERDAQRAGGFKPLLSKNCIERYLPKIEQSKTVEDDAKKFARMYSTLSKGKKLGNVLMDDAKPTERDLDRTRYDALNQLVAEGKEESAEKWGLSELWNDDGSISEDHLQLIAWAWSPVKESKLP